NAPSVIVSNTIPVGSSFVSATTSQGSASFAAGVVTASVGTISNGANATITIQVTPNAAGPQTNRAEVNAAGVDLAPADNSATTIVTANNPVADMAILVSAAPQPVFISSNVTFSVLVTNRGPNHAGAVQI